MEENTNKAYQYALRILNQRDYSEASLKKKFQQRGHDQSEQEEALQKLRDYNFIDDERYAMSRIRSLIRKGRSAMFIQHALKKDDIYMDQDKILEVFEELGTTQDKQIQALIEKKMRLFQNKGQSIEDKKVKDKLVRYIISRGFSLSAALQNIDQTC